MKKLFDSIPRVCALVVLLLGYVMGAQAATITYKLTTHTRTTDKTLTGTANLSEGADLNANMPQALWRAYCTYTYYSDEAMTQEITTAPSSAATVYVDYVFDPPFIMSEEGSDPVWHYLRSYNSGGVNNYVVYYDQDAENEWGTYKQTIKGWKSTNSNPTPTYGRNNAMTKAEHDQWAFYGDAYDFHIKLNDSSIANPWMIWRSTTRNETAMGLGAKPTVGWQLYVNTATNSKLSSGTMAMGPYNATNYLASLENVSSNLETDGLDTSKQFFDSHNQLVHKTGTSSSTSYRNQLWWYAFFATPVTVSSTTTDIWRVTYKILKAYDYKAQRGNDHKVQKPQSTAIIHDSKFNTNWELAGCSYMFYKDAELTQMFGESETLPTGCNSVVYVKESCPQTDHWMTMVSPFTISDVTKYFGSKDDGKTPAATVLEYTSVATTDMGNDVVSVNLTFSETTTMAAHTPYLVKFDEVGTIWLDQQAADNEAANASEGDLVEVTFSDINVPNVNVSMKGTYDGFTLTPQSSANDPAYFYFGYNPKYDPESDSYDAAAAEGKTPYNFYVVKKNNATIPAYRCYFYAEGTSGSVNLSMMGLADGIGEVITDIIMPTPLMGVYNLKGQKVRDGNTIDGLPAGIYVVNGKKLVVR